MLLASTSTLWGTSFLSYLTQPIQELFAHVQELIFVPYAQPSGISYDEYTMQVSAFFRPLGITVKGLHQFENPIETIQKAEAIFVGGGNTFLLVKQLHEMELMKVLQEKIQNAMPYLGCSAGTNIVGVSMQATNDMPIVYPPSFNTLGVVPFNFNVHFVAGNPNANHQGETRETRIKEGLLQNTIPVLGLPEGSWLRVKEHQTVLCGSKPAVWFGIHETKEFKVGECIKHP